MATKDVEKVIKSHLLNQGITTPVYLQSFPVNAEKKAIFVRRDGSYGVDIYLPIDYARVQICCRAEHPSDALDLALRIKDILHRGGPEYWGTSPDRAYVYHCEINAGPIRYDDPETELCQQVMFFILKVREE